MCGLFGECSDRDECVCDLFHTGPWCHAHRGFDPIDWEPDIGLGFYPPNLSPPVVGSMVLVCSIAVVLIWAKVRQVTYRPFHSSSFKPYFFICPDLSFPIYLCSALHSILCLCIYLCMCLDKWWVPCCGVGREYSVIISNAKSNCE